MKKIFYALFFLLSGVSRVYALTSEQMQTMRKVMEHYDAFTTRFKNKVSKHYSDQCQKLVLDDYSNDTSQRPYQTLFDQLSQLRKLFVEVMKKSGIIDSELVCDHADGEPCHPKLFDMTLSEIKKKPEFIKLINEIAISDCFALIMDEFRDFFQIDESAVLDEQFYKSLEIDFNIYCAPRDKTN